MQGAPCFGAVFKLYAPVLMPVLGKFQAVVGLLPSNLLDAVSLSLSLFPRSAYLSRPEPCSFSSPNWLAPRPLSSLPAPSVLWSSGTSKGPAQRAPSEAVIHQVFCSIMGDQALNNPRESPLDWHLIHYPKHPYPLQPACLICSVPSTNNTPDVRLHLSNQLPLPLPKGTETKEA